MMLYEWQQLTE